MKTKNYKMIQLIRPKQTGFALLYIMLILASFIVALSLATNKSTFFSANRLKSYTISAEVRMIAMSCGEHLLMQIRNNPSLTGVGTLDYNGGSCSYDVSGSVPVKIITITATKNNLNKKITIETTEIYPVILATWIETN